jgi:type IV secretion system protein VirB6
MDIQVAGVLFQFIDAALKPLLSGGVRNVMLGLGALIGTFWQVNFVLRSMRWYWLGMTGIFQDVFFELLKVAFIAGMAFNIGWYLQTIVPFVTDGAAWMGGVMSGLDGSQTNQVDMMLSTYIDSLMKLFEALKFPMTDLQVTLMSVVTLVLYIGGGLPFLVTVVCTLVVMKAATTMVLALGPLFIAFALFDATRHWYWGWVSQIAGFMLTQVMFAVVLALEISFINQNIIKEGTIDTSIPASASMLFFFAAFTMLATGIPNYAASMMGGAPAQGGSGIGAVMGKATGFSTAQRMAGAIHSKIRGKNNIK